MITTQPPAPPQPRKRHRARNILLGTAGAVVLLVIASVALASQPGTSITPATGPSVSATTAPSAPTTPAAPVPSPDGKYQWSGDYLLANGIYDQNYLIGEVDLSNTGNVGEVVRVRFSWPQEATLPITRTRTVRLPYGASKVVRFRVAVGSYDQGAQAIDLLQSWQEHHNGEGYKARVTLLRTFGPAH